MGLLERLEAVEIDFSICKKIIDFRIDANTYKKDYLLSEKLLSKLDCNSIDDLSSSVQNFGAYSLCSFINFTETGIPFLMTENIRHNFIDWNIRKNVDDVSHEMLYKSHCKKGQVLVTMAGEYLGRVAVYDRDFVCSSNQAIAKITLKENINPYSVSTFLNSRHGQNQINRYRTITGQPNINMSLIKSLLIPSFKSEMNVRIQSHIQQSEKLKELSVKLYNDAESLLLQEIELLNFQPSKEPINVKSFKDSFGTSGRLDAEYYQKKYEDVIVKVKSKKSERLKNIVDIHKSIEPGSNYYSDDETGLPFMRVADYNKFGLTEPNKRLTLDFVKDNQDKIDELKPKKGTVLFSKDGSVGTAYLIREDFEGVNSSAILHLKIKNPKELLPEYLTLALNSKVVQMQAERDAGGSIILHWRVGEIENVIVPIVDFVKQKQIAVLVEESFKLKKQSEQLLEVAKRSVEIAIEENEAKALKYIEQNMI